MCRYVASWGVAVVLLCVGTRGAIAQQIRTPQPYQPYSYQPVAPQLSPFQANQRAATVFSPMPLPIAPIPSMAGMGQSVAVPSPSPSPLSPPVGSFNPPSGITGSGTQAGVSVESRPGGATAPMAPQVGAEIQPDRSAEITRQQRNADPIQPRSRITNPQLQNVPNSVNMSHSGVVQGVQWEPNYRFTPGHREWQNMAAPRDNSFGYVSPPYYQAPVSQGHLAPNSYFGPKSQSWSNVLPTSLAPHHGGGWNYSPW